MMESATVKRRKIIKIDEEKCDGCGQCLPNCPEGAIQIIEGKARLVSDLFCDGLGACLGHCPQRAITIEDREAAPYDERQVMANVVRQGPAVVQAHLKHLEDHQDTEHLREALLFLQERRSYASGNSESLSGRLHPSGGCPGSHSMAFTPRPVAPKDNSGASASHLRHWPIQLHLINPHAPHYRGANLLLAADCVPFAVGNFHAEHLAGKTLAIACPKLDSDQEVYVEKLTALVDQAQVQSITVMIMQVPCCGGLLRLAQAALARSPRPVPLECVVISLQGTVLERIRVTSGHSTIGSLV
jgi:NAD-dependent dihydropyrimidine dehydrogenase PreA subunit